ncbi:MAG: sensor histidine kinase [Chthoniobacteraceae bacterium]
MTFSPLIRAILAAFVLCAIARADDSPLTTAAEVRRLSQEDAGAARPVRLRGVVTYLTPNGTVFFMQDDSGGVCVSGPRDKTLRPELRLGAIVEVEAVTAAGREIPHVTARRREQMKVSVVGEAPLPEPKTATVAQLTQPQFQEVRVEVTGVIRSAHTEPLGTTTQETLLFVLADGHSRATIALPGWRGQPALPQQFVGATVRVQGVYSASPIDRQPLFADRLLISALKDFHIEQPAQPAFERAALPIESAREFAHEESEPEQVRVQGVTTVAVPGKGMFVEDTTGGIWIDTAAPAAPGDLADVVGFPAVHEGGPVLEDAQWRKSDLAVTLAPPLVTATEATSGALDGRLVQMEALLLGVSSAGEGPTLVLQSADRVFLARCGNPRSRLPSLGENSWLLLTGVCVNTQSPQMREAALGRAMSFHLLVSGPLAIEIARTPSWWTVRRIVTLMASLGALALAAMVWATTLSWRVTKQTDQIREHLAREAVAEERLRIARELHDSVQQDLLGITMQLKATERLLDEPDRARHALTLASAMARRSQAETHRAVWDLREAADERSDLVSSLEDMVAGMNTEEGAMLEFSHTGERRQLPQTAKSHIMRIAQEAVSNAVKHGAAGRIAIELHFGDDKVTLTVRDDGRGFDADHAPTPSSGHFGLFGMKERAIKLNAELHITSRPGEGTAVRLSLPIPAETEVNEPLRTPTGLRFIPRPSTS